ncbi:MAG: GNAT family N-acetyltransferase [Chloroflexi bacterium]|nr:GNAT family N-acetyltransferase [Chloroflexota bacterium]
MPVDSVRIERVKLKDLPALAASAVDSAPPGTFIPITKHRALAMTHNPLADPDDIALLLAKQGDRNVGYFGVMPVMLQHEGKLHKAHWLTTWAVAPEFLGKGLGSQLMEAALALDVDLAIVGSKPARRVSTKYGFHELNLLDYVQLDLGVFGRFNPLSLLLRFVHKWASFIRLRLPIDSLDRAFEKFFETILGPLMRPLIYLWACRKTESVLQGLHIEVVEQVQPSKVEEPDRIRTGFYRDSRVVNWMLAYPWVLPAGKSDSEPLNYGFTDARAGFKMHAWQLSSATGANLGYICFQSSQLRNRTVVKALDAEFAQGADSGRLLALTLRFARQQGAELIEGSADLAAPLGNGLLSRLLVVRRQRTCQVHPRSVDSPMARAWQQIEQTYCDGDMAFT